jgi:hypothetical protein
LQKLAEVVKKSHNVIDVNFDNVNQGWEKWILLRSDAHHDSRDCDRELELEHLELAQKRKAYILDFGDIFDAMQGRYDPRRSYPEMREEYADAMIVHKKSYLDLIVDDAAKFYKPYKSLWVLQGYGNHETSIQRHVDTNLIERFAHEMGKDGGIINTGGYGGWVVFHFAIGGTQRESIKLKYFHGSGGGGPVTKGVIQSNRQAVFLPDADIVIGGHIHESWILSMPRERISDKGVIGTDMQYHVRTPTYKNDYGDGSGNWHVERGAPPKPRGCVWLRFYLERKHIRLQLIQDVR